MEKQSVKKKRPRVVKTTVAIDIEAKERFRELFPQSGSLQWFLNECLRAFVKIHDPKTELEIEDTVKRVTTIGYKELAE